MTRGSKVILSIIIASFVANSYQLQCYHCVTSDPSKIKKVFEIRSVNNDDCGSFTDSVLLTCPPNKDLCLKTDVQIDGKNTTVHQCGTSIECKTYNDQNAGYATCYSCDTDKCNSATGIAAATSLLGLSFLAAMF